MHLVMLETNGNQRFIFSSPRLRDSVGASSLLTKLEQWTAHELLATGAAAAWCTARGLPDDREPHESQWVSKSSGKVIFLVDTPQQAKDVIGAVTRTALAEAPGMDVSGVFISLPTPSDSQPGSVYVTESALKEVHAEAARYALQRPPAEARFSQLPFLARAKDSSLPASPPLATRDEAKDDRQDALSLTSRVRRYRAYQARLDLLKTGVNRSPDLSDKQALLIRDPTMLAKKLHQVFVEGIEPVGDEGRPSPEESVARGAKEFGPLERAIQTNPDASSTASPDTDSGDYTFLSKVAVIHIDGNGVGGIMKDLNDSKDRVAPAEFQEEIGCDRDDPDALRRFLLAVNERLQNAVEHAFAAAWTRIDELSYRDDKRAGREHAAIPVVPVILGGDDVTVITSGDYALPFAAAYLRHYEQLTGDDPLLKHLGREEGTGPMTAAAGVAVVRRDFPFHVAYNLAERLVGEAKKVGKARKPVRSTLTYHALFDSSVLDPAGILQAYSSFTTRPFLLRRDGAPASDPPGRYEPWPDTCERVRQFKGFTSEDPSTGEPRFPKTRAARIRKLLSDAAQARLVDRGLSDRLTNKAEHEWNDARDALSNSVVEGMGTRALFDLMELSDLLPDSYLNNPSPALSPADGSEPATTQEVQE